MSTFSRFPPRLQAAIEPDRLPGSVARFASTLSARWLALEPVRVGRVPAGHGTPTCYVTIESDGAEPLLRCDVYSSGEPECFAFQDVRIWKSWLVIGFGDALHLVGLDGEPTISVALGCYFGHTYPSDECLLVASCDHLHRFDADGSMRWRSAQLGLDGVVVDRVEGDAVEGRGEWDPPGGWRPFKVSLGSGTEF